MKAIYKIFMFVGLLAFVSACFDDPGTDLLLDGAAVIEINEATTATGLDVSKSYNRVTDGLKIKDSIRVNLVGPQRSTPVNVTFTIDPASTAVAGTHYSLITTNSVTIPANASFGYNYFEVIDDSILPGETKGALGSVLRGLQSENIEIKESGEHIILLDRRGAKCSFSIKGQVSDTKTGGPLAHATVYAVNEREATATNAAGLFTLEVAGQGERIAELISRASYHDTIVHVGGNLVMSATSA